MIKQREIIIYMGTKLSEFCNRFDKELFIVTVLVMFWFTIGNDMGKYPIYEAPNPISVPAFYADTGEDQFDMYEEIKKNLVYRYQIGQLPIHNESPKGLKEEIAKVEKKYGIPFDAKTNIMAHKKALEIMEYTNGSGVMENLLSLASVFGSSETLLYLIKEKGLDPNMLYVGNNNIIWKMAKLDKWATIKDLVEAGVIKDETLQVCLGVRSCEKTVYDVLMTHASQGLFDAKNVMGNTPEMRRLFAIHGVVSAREIEVKRMCFSDDIAYVDRDYLAACKAYITQMSFRCENFQYGCDELEREVIRINSKTKFDSFTEQDWLAYKPNTVYYDGIY